MGVQEKVTFYENDNIPPPTRPRFSLDCSITILWLRSRRGQAIGSTASQGTRVSIPREFSASDNARVRFLFPLYRIGHPSSAASGRATRRSRHIVPPAAGLRAPRMGATQKRSWTVAPPPLPSPLKPTFSLTGTFRCSELSHIAILAKRSQILKLSNPLTCDRSNGSWNE